METTLYTALEEKFIKEWLSLWESCPNANYVNSPQWFLSILDTFGYKKYKIIAIYRDKNLTAVAAFVTEKKYGAVFHTMPPGNFVYDIPFLVNIQDREILNEVSKEMAKLGNVFIENIPEQIVENMKKSISNLDATFLSMNHYLHFEKDEKNNVIITNRKKLVRKIKNMEEKWTLISHTGENSTILDIVFSIDDQSRKHSRGYSTFVDQCTKNLYISFAKHFKKNFQIFILYFENKPIAYRLGFIVKHTYYGSQTSFLNEYQQYWPGNVLLVKVIDHLHSLGVTKIDFGSGDTYSKRSVANGSRTLKNIIISKNMFIRNYIRTIYFCKNILFDYLVKNAKVYTIYRSIKNVF